jgi:maltose O-acetyltransferase
LIPFLDGSPEAAEHRRMLRARMWAISTLRLARARGIDVEWGEGVRFYDGRPLLQGRGKISFGDYSRTSGLLARPLFYAGEGAELVIGRLSGCQYGVEIVATAGVEIGENSLLGPYVTIYDSSRHQLDEDTPVKQAAIRIGDNAWIGHGATILPGVTVADQSVVGAGAVVNRDVPPRTLVAGNPAKVVRELRVSDSWRRT